MKYKIYYGNSVPFNSVEFKVWKDACAFMKSNLEKGTQINSVNLIAKDDD